MGACRIDDVFVIAEFLEQPVFPQYRPDFRLDVGSDERAARLHPVHDLRNEEGCFTGPRHTDHHGPVFIGTRPFFQVPRVSSAALLFRLLGHFCFSLVKQDERPALVAGFELLQHFPARVVHRVHLLHVVAIAAFRALLPQSFKA